MKWLHSFFNFYINASIHVALAVVALTLITAMEYKMAISNTLFLFIFSGTVIGYNFVKYAEVAGLHHRRLTDSLKIIQVFSSICLLILIWLSFQLSAKTLMITAIFMVVTLLYAVPFIVKRNLRNFASLKIFVVALVWAGVTVIIPIVSADSSFTFDFILTFIQRFLVVVVLTIPFEIRDLNFDIPSLRTLPQLLGIRMTKIFGTVLLFLMLILEFFKEEFNKIHSISFMLITAIIALFLWSSKRNQKRYYASFCVEALPIVWFILFWFLHKLF